MTVAGSHEAGRVRKAAWQFHGCSGVSDRSGAGKRQNSRIIGIHRLPAKGEGHLQEWAAVREHVSKSLVHFVKETLALSNPRRRPAPSTPRLPCARRRRGSDVPTTRSEPAAAMSPSTHWRQAQMSVPSVFPRKLIRARGMSARFAAAFDLPAK